MDSREGARATQRGAQEDRELLEGSRAHYEDAAYYTATYKKRIDDVAFYVDLGRKAGSVLEYGIGNGRIALPLARHGVHVTGIDHSQSMLEDLEARLSGEPIDVRKRVKHRFGDMRSLRLRRRFPLVVCPFNAALHLYTRGDVERFFACVHAHLEPRGTFVADLSIPVLEDLVRDPNRAYHAPRFRHPTTKELVRYYEYFDYDEVRQIAFVQMVHEPVDHPQKTSRTLLAHRQFFPQEWEALLHYNGFEVVAVSGDFQGGPLDRNSDVMVWHARARRRRGGRQ